MAIKLPSNMSRNRFGVLHFRLAVPVDLHPHFRVREIYRSLRTASVREAIIDAQTLSTAFKRLFQALRHKTMSNSKNRLKPPLGEADAISIGYCLEIEFDQFRNPKKVKIDAEHHEEAAVNSALDIIFQRDASNSTASTQSSPPRRSSNNLSTYIEAYLCSTPAEHRPNENTLDSYRAAINTFIKIVVTSHW